MKKNAPYILAGRRTMFSELRKKLGLTQGELASLLGLSQAMISLLEQEKAQPAKQTQILCKILLKYPDILKNLD